MTIAYVANGPSIAFERFDDEAVLINFQTGTYYSLRGAAPEVWALVQQPNTIDRIAEQLGVQELAARAAIEAMLKQLVADTCVLVREIDDAELKTVAQPLAKTKHFTPPIVQAFHDLEELIVLDPVHEVDPMDGWPNRPPPFGLGTYRSE